jgi:hypothetical protein
MAIKTSYSLTGHDRFKYQIAVNGIEANERQSPPAKRHQPKPVG